MTQAEIGAVIGVSQMQVSRVIRQAISRLRAAADSRRPPPALAGVRATARSGHETSADGPTTTVARGVRAASGSTASSTSSSRSCASRCPACRCCSRSSLAVPFQQRFTAVTEFQKDVYFVTLLAAAAASALFIAPDRVPPAAVRARATSRASSRIEQARPRRARRAGGRDERRGAARHRRALRRRHRRDDRRAQRALFVGLWFVLGLVRDVQGGSDSMTSAARSDPRRRRHARRLQLPARARLVPRVSPARPHDPGLALSSRDRDGRRPARAVSRRRGLRRASRATPSAAEEHALYAQMIHEVQPFAGARGLIEDLKARGCKVVLASSAKSEDVARLPRPARRSRARRRLDGLQQRRAHEARARSRRGGARASSAAAPAVMIGDSTWDIEAAKAREGQDDLRAHGRIRRRRAARGRRRRGLRLDRRAARAVVRDTLRVGPATCSCALARSVTGLQGAPSPARPRRPVVPEPPSVADRARSGPGARATSARACPRPIRTATSRSSRRRAADGRAPARACNVACAGREAQAPGHIL